MPTFNTAFRVPGTITWRLASAKFLRRKNFGFGGNAQNIPDEVRRVLIPRDGYSIINNDFEAAEAVVVAMLCGEGNFRKLIRYKIKPHNFLLIKIFPEKFAAWLTEQEARDMTPDWLNNHPAKKAMFKHCKSLPMEYDLAKRTIHGYNYGEGWRTYIDVTLRETKGALVLTAAQAKAFMASTEELFPEIRGTQVQAEFMVETGMIIRNLFGHPCQFIARYNPALGRRGIAWRPQSTVAQCSNVAANLFQDYIEEQNLRWNLLNIVHDSLVSEAPDAEAVSASNICADCMKFELTSPLDGWKWTIGVERSIGKNWGKYDETENPEGVKVIE